MTTKRIRDFEREGYEVRVTGSGHLRLTSPELSGPVFTANTPSDSRDDRNIRALLKRNKRAKSAQ